MALSLFDDNEVQTINQFPTTRYQGSKSKFVDWIWHEIQNIPFQICLDAFGGTGSVAYKLKNEGKEVTYNDILPFNYIIGKCLIENNSVKLGNDELTDIITEHSSISYPNFVENNFKDIYFTDEENHWIDVVRYNISQLDNEYKRAIAWFALFQSCIIKRPYNLFHRKNLYVRMMEVKRSFGNKKTWDTPFEVHFRNFVKEANNAIFDNGSPCHSLNMDAKDVPNEFDLVYIDTPYLNDKGVGVDYGDFYHFLNGLVNYDNWQEMIDFNSKHLRLKRNYNIWNDKNNIREGFRELIEHFPYSTLVFSYRSNGIPTIDELVNMLNEHGRRTEVRYSGEMKYALSDTKTKEVLIISQL